MMEFLQSAFAFILAIGVLITFHEFGHFWVARCFDVKILRFSIGFGRPLFVRRFGADESEFVIAALPLGGYVKMLDEREGEVALHERQRAFNNKPLLQRSAVVLAGPVFNLLFAVFAYWVMYMVGTTGLRPVIGEVQPASLAQQSGFRAGDEILRVDNNRTQTWATVVEGIITEIVDEQEVVFGLRDADGHERELVADMSRFSIDDIAGGQLLSVMGIEPQRPHIPALIGEILPDGAAERAGIETGDRVIAVNGEMVQDWPALVEVIRARPGGLLQMEVVRDSDTRLIEVITDTDTTETGESIGKIGVGLDTAYQTDPALMAKESYSFFPALIKGTEKTAQMSLMTLKLLGKMIVGDASVKNLSGPITIARYAGQSAEMGIAVFLGFLAIVSVSLGVLNLLPIPILDGGHLMYYLIELLKGSPVSEAVQMIGQQIGVAILLCLMGLAFYNDILRLAG